MFDTKSGAALATALEPLAPANLHDVQLRDVVRSYERMIAWAQAGQLAALAEMADRNHKADAVGVFASAAEHDPHGFVADEVAVELAITRVSASNRCHLAVEVQEYPDTWEALRAGVLDLPKVREIVEQLQVMESAAAIESLEAAAIDYGSSHTRPQLAAWLRRRVIAHEPALAEARRTRAERGRKLMHLPGVDGMGSILAELPAHDAVAVWRMVDQVASASRFKAADVDATEGTEDVAADSRSMDQRRADTFVDLILGRVQAPASAEVLVTVSAATLAGVSQEPGELVGVGPITADHARELAADATWRRLLVDPADGHLLEVGQCTYRPGRVMTRAIQLRDQTCRFPGCRRVATGCDLDHTVPWPRGQTEESNLAALCRSHHRLKTHGDWQVVQRAGGILEWTSPTGRVFRTQPADYTCGRPVSRGDPPDLAA